VDTIVPPGRVRAPLTAGGCATDIDEGSQGDRMGIPAGRA